MCMMKVWREIMMKKGDAQVHTTGGSGMHKAKLYYNVSLRLWGKILEEERRNEDVMDLRLCHVSYNYAILNSKQQNFEVAETTFQEIITIHEKYTTDGDEDLEVIEVMEFAARANNCLGNIKFKANLYYESIAYYEAADKLRKRNRELNEEAGVEIDDSEETIGLYTNLGRAYFQEKDIDAALKYFQRANRLLMATPHQNELPIAENWIQMGKAHFSKKEYDEARELYEDALTMLQNVLQDEKHLKILHVRHDIAMAYCREGEYDEGLEVLLDVLAKKKEREESDLYLVKIHFDLCSIYIKLHRRQKAKVQIRNAYEILADKKVPKKHPYMLEKRKYDRKIMALSETSDLASSSYDDISSRTGST